MVDPSSVSVFPSISVMEALKALNEGAVQILLIVDPSTNRLVGILTDGDIRRGLLSGRNLQDNVALLMNKNYHAVSIREDVGSALAMMKDNDILQLPALDDDGRVVKLHLHHELIAPKSLSNPVVIMAGGLGKRLRPYTENCPKPMLLVGGKPMLQILLEQFICEGFNDFYFSVNYLREQIIDFFGDGSKWSVSIKYLIEDRPLGTAGSLNLLPVELNEPILVINGDVLTRLNPRTLLQFHESNNADATMCVREHILDVPFGVVETKGIDLLSINEKPSYGFMVNAGIYVINPSLISLINHSEYLDMPALMQRCQDKDKRVTACPIHEYWIDIGRPESLKQAFAEWSS